MELVMMELGRMGTNMVRRLMRAGHKAALRYQFGGHEEKAATKAGS